VVATSTGEILPEPHSLWWVSAAVHISPRYCGLAVNEQTGLPFSTLYAICYHVCAVGFCQWPVGSLPHNWMLYCSVRTKLLCGLSGVDDVSCYTVTIVVYDINSSCFYQMAMCPCMFSGILFQLTICFSVRRLVRSLSVHQPTQYGLCS